MIGREALYTNGKKLRYWLVFFVLTTLVYMLMELRYGPPIWALCPKHYVTVAVFAVYPCLIYNRRVGASSGYAGELFLEYQNKPGRIVYMDYLRVLVALLVTLVCILEPACTLLPPRTFTRNMMAASADLGLSCNLLFMMLSGALLLGEKEEPVLGSYPRRFVRVLISCLAYYLFYFSCVEGISVLSPGNWGNLLQSLLSGDNGQTPHLWLVCIILMFYVAAPFFQIMLKYMIEPMLEMLAAVVIILHFTYIYGPLVRVGFAASASLASWGFIFLLGYYCTTQSATKYHRLSMTAGLLSGLAIAAAIMASESLGSLVYSNVPSQTLFICAVFLFFRKHGDSLFARISTLLPAIGKHSFSILLVHWLVLHQIVGNVFGINGLSFEVAGGIPASFLLTLVTNLVPALLYDNTTVLCMDGAHGILFGTLRRARRRL